MQRRITSSYYNYYYKNKVRLINKIISKFRYKNQEELMSIGKIELLYSMIHFDKTLASFNTYLFQRIYGNILRFIRDEKEWCKNIDMDLNTIKNKSHDISNTILIKEILSSLSERERKILELYYLENNTLREISDKLDLSTNCIFINKIKALKRIKETFDCL